MTSYIGLLRAVNLGSHNRVPMSGLRDCLVELGFSDPRTLLQSGNVVFRGVRRAIAGLERLLEAELEKRLGVRTDIVVRTAEDWKEIVARNPFPVQAERDPGRLVVMFCKEAPAAQEVQRLRAGITGPELVGAEGKQVYIVYPRGIGISRLTNSVIEKRLGTRGTGRNWNTVLKLYAMTVRTTPCIG
jgi:uncharacterized protein (DUF1697 family)